MPTLLVTRPGPHKLLLLVASTVLGVVYSVGVPPPTSVSATQPRWAVHVWAAAMLLSGVAGIAAAFWRNVLRSLHLESGAMLLGSAAMMLYTLSLIAYAGWVRSLSGAIVFALWSGANLWRAAQIRHDLREIQ